MKSYPFYVHFRDGYKLLVVNKNQAWLASFGIHAQYNTSNDITSFDFNNKHLSFEGAGADGDLAEIFGKLELDILSVKDKDVLDIGANIGDSSIYFAVNGAKRVIAVEAFPQSYKFLINNIKLNRCSSKVIGVNAAVGQFKGRMKINTTNQDTTLLQATSSEYGKEIDCVTIDYLVDKYNLSDAILKMDCEGCEYDVFGNMHDGLLYCFEQIFLEYHKGLKRTAHIVETLRNANFKVEIFKKDKISGHIHATKQ